MSNPNRSRDYANSGSKSRAGNNSGNSSKRRTFQNQSRNQEDKTRQQVSSPDNHEASSSQPSGFDDRSNKSGKKHNFGNGSETNYESQIPSRGNLSEVRAFSIRNNTNAGTESEENLSSKESIRQRCKSDVNSFRNVQSFEKLDPDTSGSEKSSNSVFAYKPEPVRTRSGIFECSSNLPDQTSSSQNDSNNPQGCNETGETQDEGRPSKGKSCVIEIDGDLFTASHDVSLVHCVGADLRMGSGVAVRFREQFKSVGKLFDQRVGPGGLAFIKSRQRYVFYLITKQASTDKPTIDMMKKSLLALRKKCKQLHVTKLAMPRIGCGLDGLSWDEVKQMLEEIFADDFLLTIYKLDVDIQGMPKRGFKSQVKNVKLTLKDIQQGTGLLYIGYAKKFCSEEMKSINQNYPFIKQLRSSPYKPGSICRTKVNKDDVVYGLICKNSGDSPLSYEHLESSIEQLRKINTSADGYEYFGIQAFEEKDDPHVMAKIETLLRNSYINAEFWICWPPTLEHMCPSNSEQNEEGTQVQESQYCVAVQQSGFEYPLNSAKPSKAWESNDNSRNIENKYDDIQRNAASLDGVREVGEKMNQQSLVDASQSGISVFDLNSSQTTNDPQNISGMDWSDESHLREISKHVDSSHDTEDEGWPDQRQWDKSYVEDEKRKSFEKKQAIQLNNEKEKQNRKSARPKSCVTECKGDLFDAEDTVCLAHCVGADFRMGSGIAVLFRQNFGSVDELLNQRVQQGGVACIRHDKRYIFYLVTKRESTGKPTYQTLEKSLHELRAKCKELKVTELAMPRIGCGLDRLEWDEVKKMLEEIFADGFTIRIYNLQKDYQETKQSMPKTIIKNEVLHLKDIQQGTGLLFIGTVEYFVSEEMKSLNEKYPFLQRLDKSKAKLGTVVRTEVSYPHEVVYGLICKQSRNDPVNFTHLKAALKQLRTVNKTDQYRYFGIQAFKEKGDPYITGKIETMLRYSYIEVDVWICYPPSLKDLMPQSSSPTISTHTSGGGKTRWGETDHQRFVATTLRDITQEAIYRKLLEVLDGMLSADGSKANQIVNQFNEISGWMQDVSSKIDNCVQTSHSSHERYEDLLERVAALETIKPDLGKIFELLEQRLPPPTSTIRDHTYLNGDYRSNFPDSPLRLLQNPASQRVCPSPADYYGERMRIYHPGYLPNPQIYASEQLPDEKQVLTYTVKQFASENGYEFRLDENGIIQIRKNARHRFKSIYTYGDLSTFEGSRA